MSAKTPPNQNPKSEIQNLKSKIQNPKFAQEELLHKAPKSKIRNPKSKIRNPKSKNPKSKIRNPKSKIQNSGNLGRWGPHVKECYITIQNPKSTKSTKSGRKSLDFGLGNFGFWVPDFGFWGGPGDVPLGNSVTVPWGQRLESPMRCGTNRIWYGWGKGGHLVVETRGKASKAYIFPCFCAGLGYLCAMVRLWRPVWG